METRQKSSPGFLSKKIINSTERTINKALSAIYAFSDFNMMFFSQSALNGTGGTDGSTMVTGLALVTDMNNPIIQHCSTHH
jgi:hypothetical protein